MFNKNDYRIALEHYGYEGFNICEVAEDGAVVRTQGYADYIYMYEFVMLHETGHIDRIEIIEDPYQ